MKSAVKIKIVILTVLAILMTFSFTACDMPGFLDEEKDDNGLQEHETIFVVEKETDNDETEPVEDIEITFRAEDRQSKTTDENGEVVIDYQAESEEIINFDINHDNEINYRIKKINGEELDDLPKFQAGSDKVEIMVEKVESTREVEDSEELKEALDDKYVEEIIITADIEGEEFAIDRTLTLAGKEGESYKLAGDLIIDMEEGEVNINHLNLGRVEIAYLTDDTLYLTNSRVEQLELLAEIPKSSIEIDHTGENNEDYSVDEFIVNSPVTVMGAENIEFAVINADDVVFDAEPGIIDPASTGEWTIGMFRVLFKVEDKTGNSVENVPVSFADGLVWTDESGVAEFKEVSRGEHEYLVDGDGYEKTEENITVEEDETIFVELDWLSFDLEIRVEEADNNLTSEHVEVFELRIKDKEGVSIIDNFSEEDIDSNTLIVEREDLKVEAEITLEIDNLSLEEGEYTDELPKTATRVPGESGVEEEIEFTLNFAEGQQTVSDNEELITALQDEYEEIILDDDIDMKTNQQVNLASEGLTLNLASHTLIAAENEGMKTSEENVKISGDEAGENLGVLDLNQDTLKIKEDTILQSLEVKSGNIKAEDDLIINAENNLSLNNMGWNENICVQAGDNNEADIILEETITNEGTIAIAEADSEITAEDDSVNDHLENNLEIKTVTDNTEENKFVLELKAGENDNEAEFKSAFTEKEVSLQEEGDTEETDYLVFELQELEEEVEELEEMTFDSDQKDLTNSLEIEVEADVEEDNNGNGKNEVTVIITYDNVEEDNEYMSTEVKIEFDEDGVKNIENSTD